MLKKISHNSVEFMVRPMGLEDIVLAVTIEKSYSWGHWSYLSFCGSLQGSDESWVLLKDNAVCAFIIFREMGDEAELLNIAVSPVLQKTGVGSILVRLMLQQLHAKKKTAMFFRGAPIKSKRYQFLSKTWLC